MQNTYKVRPARHTRHCRDEVAESGGAIVNANQLSLTTAVRQFRAGYQQEVSRLAALLKTAKATPFLKPTQVTQGKKAVG